MAIEGLIKVRLGGGGRGGGLTDDVGSLLGHTDQLSTRTVRELDGVDDTVGADNVRDVGDG